MGGIILPTIYDINLFFLVYCLIPTGYKLYDSQDFVSFATISAVSRTVPHTCWALIIYLLNKQISECSLRME